MDADVVLVVALVVLAALVVIALLVSRCGRRGSEQPPVCPLVQGRGWVRPPAPPPRRAPHVNRYGELED
jgi:hypothetical protein